MVVDKTLVEPALLVPNLSLPHLHQQYFSVPDIQVCGSPTDDRSTGSVYDLLVGPSHSLRQICNHIITRSRYLPTSKRSSSMAQARTAEIQRITNETKIDVSINLDAYPGNSFGVKQEISVSTGIGFLDHVRYLPC